MTNRSQSFADLRICIFTFLSVLVLGNSVFVSQSLADEPDVQASEAGADKSKQDSGNVAKSRTVQIDSELKSVLDPLFAAVRESSVSRTTIEMTSDALLQGQLVEQDIATFQIASKLPGKFTIYMKRKEARTRLFCDGRSCLVAMAPDAYFRLKEPPTINDAVLSLDVPLGIYPEPILALSMAGYDPAVTFIAGMKTIRIADRKPFRGKVPAVHIEGVQADEVKWDLWVTDEAKPKPLRILVDMTPMLRASKDVHVPAGYSQQIRYDFATWRVTGEVDDSLFVFRPAKDAIEYESMQDYIETLNASGSYHPMLGRNAPKFATKTLDGKSFASKAVKDRVVVLDFLTSYCEPCLAAIPQRIKTIRGHAKNGAVYIPIATGEDAKAIQTALKKQKLNINVLMDQQGAIAKDYLVESLPHTVLVGRDNLIESVHFGTSELGLQIQRLDDELQVLVTGGRIASTGEPTR